MSSSYDLTSVLYSCLSPGLLCLPGVATIAECYTIPVYLGGTMGVFGTTPEHMAGWSWKIDVSTSKVQCKRSITMHDIT